MILFGTFTGYSKEYKIKIFNKRKKYLTDKIKMKGD